jgi:hypothetical protein
MKITKDDLRAAKWHNVERLARALRIYLCPCDTKACRKRIISELARRL